MTAEKLCCGVFSGDELVSCTDAPLMPYMAGSVQEIGVQTLSEHRGKGYAADACALCAGQILESGKCPQRSCDAGNTASIRTAERVGFIRFADVITLTL